MTLSPMPRWLKTAGGYAIVPMLAPFFALIWALEWWDRTTGPTIMDGWQRWFAWTPTRLGSWDGPVVWLEPIERVRLGDAILCRRPGDTSVRLPWEMSDDEG